MNLHIYQERRGKYGPGFYVYGIDGDWLMAFYSERPSRQQLEVLYPRGAIVKVIEPRHVYTFATLGGDGALEVRAPEQKVDRGELRPETVSVAADGHFEVKP